MACVSRDQLLIDSEREKAMEFDFFLNCNDLVLLEILNLCRNVNTHTEKDCEERETNFDLYATWKWQTLLSACKYTHM